VENEIVSFGVIYILGKGMTFICCGIGQLLNTTRVEVCEKI